MMAWASQRSALGWLIVGMTLCVAGTATAQARAGLGRWQGDGTFFLNWENQDDKRLRTKYETILLQERVNLQNRGAFILDPRFLTLDLGGSFGASQEEDLGTTNSPLRVGNGTLYDYVFDGLLLSDQPYPVRFFATRNQTILTQGFGGQANTSVESRGGTVELREGNFLKGYGLMNVSSFLDAHQEFLKEDSSVFGTRFRRDESRNVVNYRLSKGGETSDADLRYEFNDVHDPFNPINVFDSHALHATHSIDFGPTLNRRLDSAFYYFTRTGLAPGSFVSADEALRLDHNSDLASTYRYDFSRSDSDTGVITTNAANLGLLHSFYRTLTTTLDAKGMRQDFPMGERTVYGGQGGFDYRRSLPWGGNLFAGTYLGYQIDDNKFSSSRIDVVDEPQTAPSVFGAGAGFTLNNPFVLTDTIVVVDVRGGSRLPTLPHVDYEITSQGSLTMIRPLPGSAVLQPGDALAVSYAFNVDSNIKYSTVTANVRLALDFAWVAASYEHTLSDQTRLAGTPSPHFLINQDVDRFKLDVKRQWNGVHAESSVGYEILSSTVVDSNTLRFGQLLTYQPRADIIAQLSGDQYFVDYPGESRRSQSYLVRTTIDWFTTLGLTVSAFSGYRAYHDTAVPSDEILDAGVRMRWIYERMEVSPSFTWTDYRTRLNDVRGELRVTRHFF